MTQRTRSDNECPTCGQVIPSPDLSRVWDQIRRCGGCESPTCPSCVDARFFAQCRKSVRPRAGRSFREQTYTDQCEHPIRELDEPVGYLAWHEWAEEKIKTEHQEWCPHCGLYAIWRPGPPKAED